MSDSTDEFNGAKLMEFLQDFPVVPVEEIGDTCPSSQADIYAYYDQPLIWSSHRPDGSRLFCYLMEDCYDHKVSAMFFVAVTDEVIRGLIANEVSLVEAFRSGESWIIAHHWGDTEYQAYRVDWDQVPDCYGPANDQVKLSRD